MTDPRARRARTRVSALLAMIIVAAACSGAMSSSPTPPTVTESSAARSASPSPTGRPTGPTPIPPSPTTPALTPAMSPPALSVATGLAWSALPLPNEDHLRGIPEGVVAVDSGFAVVGRLAGQSAWTWHRWLSRDGTSWERTPIPTFDDAQRRFTNWYLAGVVMWGDTYVAVATEEQRDHIQFWTSSDGIDWQQVPDRGDFVFHKPSDGDSFGPGAIFACCGSVTDLRVEDGVIVVEGGPFCDSGEGRPGCEERRAVARWTSADAIHWERTIVKPTYTWTSRNAPLTTSNGLIRLWNDGESPVAGIEASADGAHWQVSWRTSGYLRVLRRFSGGYLSVGYDGPSYLAASSEDGVEWVRSSGWPDMDGQMLDLVESEGRVVAIGLNGTEPSDFDGGEPILPYVWLNPPLPEAP